VQLLPLRYGLVEKTLDPGAELEMPYALTARPWASACCAMAGCT
jgi:hypothetical protein